MSWLRSKWCVLFGHRFRTVRDGRVCDRCGERRPTYKQQFGRINISGPGDLVPKAQWLADCETLLTAAMYGSPPGGWSDPDRKAAFLRDMADIEARMRAARGAK